MEKTKIFKTEKGTELTVLVLKGNKEYLEVKYRLVWFREEKPNWSIETEFVSVGERHATAKATIRDESGRIIATSHKFENSIGFADFLEKAETGAIGRALALIGYGTQFCADEFDEGKRLADSPVDERKPLQDSKPKISSGPKPIESLTSPWEFTIGFGKKYMGRKIKDIPHDDLKSYLNWLDTMQAKKNQGKSPEVEQLRAAFNQCYETQAPSESDVPFSDAPGGPITGGPA